MRKFKFPLKMKDNIEVWELEDLQENFDMEKAIEYFSNKKLMTWLENTYNDEALKKIEKLTGEESDFTQKFTEALGVKCDFDNKEIERMLWISLKKEKVKKYFPPEQAEKIAERTVEDQKELEKLVRKGENQIYLFSNTFVISAKMKDVELIGIDHPNVIIRAKTAIAFDEQNIKFINVDAADDETSKIMNDNRIDPLMNALLDVLKSYIEK